MKRIVVFASGTGSNLENLIHYYKAHTSIELCLIVSNNEHCGAIEKAKANKIPFIVLGTKHINDGNFIIQAMKINGIDYIILAGYLKMIPKELILHYPNKIINIHPALLPKYGGKGMYGNAVHKAVVLNKESVSGITIHYVNEHYDKGKIIAQKEVKVESTDTFEAVEKKVRALEILWFPQVIESVILEKQIP